MRKTNIVQWSRHRCYVNHRTTSAFLKCALGHSPSITGRGEYAIIETHKVPYMFDNGTRIRIDYFIHLYPTRDKATSAWTRMLSVPCSGTCVRHQIIKVNLESTTSW